MTLCQSECTQLYFDFANIKIKKENFFLNIDNKRNLVKSRFVVPYF